MAKLKHAKSRVNAKVNGYNSVTKDNF